MISIRISALIGWIMVITSCRSFSGIILSIIGVLLIAGGKKKNNNEV